MASDCVTLQQHIGGMFQAIDAKDHAALPRFFSNAIVYERPGFPDIVGIHDLIDFYRRRRIIASGVHRVERVVENGDAAVALGEFMGVLKNGDDAKVRFADAYVFSAGLIRRRTTYFFRAAI